MEPARCAEALVFGEMMKTKRTKTNQYGCNEGDLVIVDWIDSSGCGSWSLIEEAVVKPMTCRSVGWLQSKKNDALALYSERACRSGEKEIHSVGSRNTIPDVCIRQVKVLRRAEN